jgi:hypothetical protein
MTDNQQLTPQKPQFMNPTQLEVIPPPQELSNVTRELVAGEVDVQISTAHRFPRSLEKFQRRAIDMVSIDEETAESCIYRRPVGKGEDGRQKIAEGLSIRMAEIVAACYGNIRYGSTLIEQTERRVVARGVAHDLETNVFGSSECVESTVTKKGFPYSEGQRNVVAKAALAKARRDALFMVVPKALCKKIEAEARNIITGSKKPLSQRVAAVESWLSKIDIDPARVWAVLEVKGPAELGEEHLMTLTGLRTAIKDSDITMDDAFPKIEKSEPKPQFIDRDHVPEAAPETQPMPDCYLQLRDALEADEIPLPKLVDFLKVQKSIRATATVLSVQDIPIPKIEVILADWDTFKSFAKGE